MHVERSQNREQTMTRLLVGAARFPFTLAAVSFPVILTTLVFGNMLMAAKLLSPDGLLVSPAGGNPGSILALVWFAGNAIVAVWLACRLVTALCGQVQEWIAAISASMRWR